MLRELHIKNVAVIEEVTVSFGDGFHALTGETGAGKSILIDSIHMALGERTARELIRSGTEMASVDLVFEPSENIQMELREIGIETEDGLLYISRQISTDGKSRCRINGHMVPMSQLKEVAGYLLTIHGQNDNQSILSAKSHMGFVDNYGHYDTLLAAYQTQYQVVHNLQEELQTLLTDENEKARRIDLLTYQIQEISSSGLKDGEEEELSERKEYLAHFESIMEHTGKAYEGLYGKEDNVSAYDQISDAVRHLEQVHHFDETLDGFYQTLHSVLADVEDVTHELKTYLGRIDFEPDELDHIESRLQQIADLKRKYGSSVSEVLDYLQSAEEELAKIENSDAERKRLAEQIEKEETALYQLATELSAKRQEAAIALQTAIMKELSDLDMEKMRFSVSVEPLVDGEKLHYTKTGADKVEFLISGNPGEELKPLAKIASGGEMSRIMLAIKSVLADGDPVETLIFDEIDTGVSGRAAQKIGIKIRQISKIRQILCVTHLSQLAIMADNHLLIEKNVVDERTVTSVIPLEFDGRIKEIARIMGGENPSESMLKSAEEELRKAADI